MIKLELSVIPPVNKPGGRYKSKKGKEFEEKATFELKNQYKGKPLKGRLAVEIRLYFKTRAKRDIDNYNKGILDSMTGIVYEDDEQIDDLTVHKIKGYGKDKVCIEILER